MTIPPEEDPRDKLRRLLASEDETVPDLPTPDEKPGGSPSDETIASVMSSLGEEKRRGRTVRAPGRISPTPDTPMPALDKDNMPLPRRVDEIDVGATRVTPAAFNSLPKSTSVRPASSIPPSQPVGTRSATTNIPSGSSASRPATQRVPTAPRISFGKVAADVC